MARVLAIDYGEKRIGIAVSDVLGMIANPLRTIPPSELMPFLKTYLVQEEVEAIVIGDPKTLDNRPGPLSAEVIRVADEIRAAHPSVMVQLMDERFTSVIAAKVMVAAGYPRKQRQKKENLDKMSAAILLQDYLDSRS